MGMRGWEEFVVASEWLSFPLFSTSDSMGVMRDAVGNEIDE
jgi:hypothetical protein